MVYLPRNTENSSSEDQNKGSMIHHCGESGKVTFTFTYVVKLIMQKQVHTALHQLVFALISVSNLPSNKNNLFLSQKYHSISQEK